MFRRYIITLALIVITCGISYPQAFNATVNTTTVGQYDQFQVSFTFQGKNVNGTSNFKAPPFKNFRILSGPNQSTSMQIINGAASGTVSYSYYVQPNAVGKFTIGSASINYEGKTYRTQSLAINVVKGTPPKRRQTAQNGQSISSKEIGDNLFIRASADKRKVYMGQQVIVTYKLYTRLSIASQMSVNKLPSYEGLWAEEINVPNNIAFTTEMVKGKRYRVGLLKKVALFPSQVGELSVTPMVLDIPIQIQQQRKRSSGNIFDDFFNDPFFNNYKTVNYTAKSNTIKLDVLPLPSKDVPKSFNGAVGNYTMNSSISTKNSKTNEPISLKIDLSGQGNIQLLNMPEVNFPPGFDKFEPKTTEKINRTGTISGKKNFEYLIVPRITGKQTIPPISFSYFNPSKKSYVTLKTPAYHLDIVQGKNIQGGNTAAGLTKEEIKVLGQDINYIKTDDSDLFKGSSLAIDSVGFWTAAGLPFMLLAGLIVWKKRNDKLTSNLQLLRYQRAQKVAKGRFKTAKTLMEANDQNAFYTEISAALFGYLEDKLHIPKSEISLERAVEELNYRKIDESLTDTLRDCIEKCEYARFAPGADGKAEMNDMYKELTNVIIEIEKSITSRKVS